MSSPATTVPTSTSTSTINPTSSTVAGPSQPGQSPPSHITSTSTSFSSSSSQSQPTSTQPQPTQPQSTQSNHPSLPDSTFSSTSLPKLNGVGLLAGSDQNQPASLAVTHQDVQIGMQPQIESANGDGERRLPGGTQGFNMANAAALMGKIPGASKEQLLKQLQALQNSQAQRARLAQSNAQNSSQLNGSAGSAGDAATSISSPAAGGQTSLPANSNAIAGPSTSQPQSSTSSQAPDSSNPAIDLSNDGMVLNGMGPGPSTLPDQMTQQQKEFLLAQHERARASEQAGSSQLQSQTSSQLSNAPIAQPSVNPQSNAANATKPPPVRPQSVADQRRHFVNSLHAYYKNNNLTVPPDIFNGERDGAIKIGGVWLDLVDLFLTVMKVQGIVNAAKQPVESSLWQSLITTRGLPNPLPEPAWMPQSLSMAASLPPKVTTNTAQYLVAVYLAYLQGFEQHMTRSRQALQRHAASVAAGRPPPSGAPGLNGFTTAPSSSSASAQNSLTGALPNAPSPAQPSPAAMQMQQGQPVFPQKRGGGEVGSKVAPSPNADGSSPTTHTPAGGILSDPPKATKKRKVGKGSTGNSLHSSPCPPDPSMCPPIPERPSTPNRTRFKVEYKPLHIPLPTLAGWDERAVASTFPKNNLAHPSRSVHELGIIDMEAVLMGLRSRISRELSYALAVLSMLSMPHPEEHIGGLPLAHLPEVYLELLELVEEVTFGEDGYVAWDKQASAHAEQSDGDYAAADVDILAMNFSEMERLGRDFDLSVPSIDVGEAGWPRERTGGSTDIILTTLNLLRNLSMLKENEDIMAKRPETFILLSRIVDARLARKPGTYSSTRPYSVLELARVRRDVVVILTNLGALTNLRSVPFPCVLAIFRLLSHFLSSGFEHLISKETAYGPTPSVREVPPSVVFSIHRALEAFCKIASADSNREVLGRIPSDELVGLFENLIKLFPLTRRANEAMHTIEEFLGYTECLALSLYSLVFLSSMSARASMRSLPGVTGVIRRLIWDTISRGFDFKANPFCILCRRLCEVLGVLNGTACPTGEGGAGGQMGFSAGAGDGKGWRWASGVIQNGWLAAESDRVGEGLSVRNLDGPAFAELDGMWWGVVDG